MKDELHKEWPDAATELGSKIASGEPVILWHHDTEYILTVSQIKATRTGHRIELTGIGINVVVYTTRNIDDVVLHFYYSNG